MILPAVGEPAPAIRSTIVDLPAPFGPITPRISPLRKEKLRLSTAIRPPKRLVTLTSCSRGAPSSRAAPGLGLDSVGCDKASDTSHPLHKTVSAARTCPRPAHKLLRNANNPLWQEDGDNGDSKAEQRIMQVKAAGLELERGQFERNGANDWPENSARAAQEAEQHHFNRDPNVKDRARIKTG